MKYQIEDIEGSPGYRIDTNGDVWTCWALKSYGWRYGNKGYMSNYWKKLKPGSNRGYLHVNLKGKIHKVHHLVLNAFVGPRAIGMQACHNNGIRGDNRPENLRWDTPKNNQADRIAHGTVSWGEAQPSSKLTEDKVKMIWELLCHSRMKRVRIAKLFNVSPSTIGDIKSGRSWKCLNLSMEGVFCNY